MDDERLVEDLKFKEMCKLQICDIKTEEPVPLERYNLVVACNKYGYLYIGYDKGIKILKTAELTRLNTTFDKQKETVTDYPHVTLQLGCMPQHLSLSADGLTLSVCYRKDAALILALYDVRVLVRSGTAAVSTQVIGRDSDLCVTNLCWNPQNIAILAVCLSDGSLLLCETSAGIKVVAKLADKDSKAICWSPKGKQLVVGKGDGRLVQYDLQLNEKRCIQKPYTFDDRVTVVDVCWQSTYKFIAAYADAAGHLQPNIVIVSAPKDGDPMFKNYEDICMGDGDRQGQYYLKCIDKWGILLAMQSNGPEMGLMGKQPNNPNQWEIWSVNDDARLTLPLNADSDDTFPLGMALDTTSELAGGKPTPIVIVLSTEGKLCPFYMIYEAECQVITSPPEALPAGERQPIDSGGGDAVVPIMPGLSAPQPTSVTVVTGRGNAAGQASVRLQGGASSSSAFSFTKPSSSITPVVSSGSAAVSLGSFSFSTPAATSSTTGFSFATKTTTGTGSGFSFAPSQAPNNTSFSFTSATTPTIPFGQSPATTTTSSSGISIVSTSSSGISFVPKSTESTLSFGQVSTSSSQGFSFSSSNTFSSSTPQTSQSKTAFTPSGNQVQKVSTPGVTNQAPVAAVQLPTASQSAFSLGSSTTFSFSTPKVPTELPKPQTQAQSVSAFSQPATKPSGFSLTSTTSSGSTGINLPTQQASQGMKATGSQLPKFGASGEVVTAPGASILVTQPLSGTAPSNTQLFGSQPKPSPTVDIIRPSAAVPSTKTQDRVQPTASIVTDPQVIKPSAGLAGDIKNNDSAVTAPPTKTAPEPDKLQTAFSARFYEEMELFNRELKAHRQRSMASNYEIGTENEKKKLRESINKLTEFRQESVEVTKSINEDIHHLKSDTLNAFSLIEEAKVREQRKNDPRYVYFLKARSLDPATMKKLREIRSKQHNLDVVLKDVNACLDAAWEEQNFSRGQKKRVMKPPTLDAIYQTLSNHHNIINNLKEQLKVVKQQLLEAQCYDISAWPSPKTPSSRGIQDVEMSTVTKSMSKARVSDAMMYTPISAKKRSQLKDLLSQRSTTPIRSAKKSNLTQMYKFSNNYPDYQDNENVSVRPQNLAKELEVADNVRARQPQPFAAAKVEVEPKPDVHAASGTLGPVEEAVKPKTKSPPQPTSPAIKTTSGKVTVEWGASTKGKLTPSQAAGVAAVNRLNSQQMAAAVLVSQTTPAQKDLPPVVNIGKLDSMKESMPPPVTFAPVGSSVNAGTAKVLNDVIAEMAMASGKTTQQFTRGPKSPAAQLSPTTLPKSLENLAKPQPTSVVSVGPPPNISAPIASSAKAFTIKPDASAFSLTSSAGGQASSGKTTAASQPLKPMTMSTTLSGFSGFGIRTGTTTSSSSSLPAASSGSLTQPSFGFNSVTATGASSTTGFSFNSKPSGFNFGGASTPSIGVAPTSHSGFGFGGSVISGAVTTTSGSVKSNQGLVMKPASEEKAVSQSSTTGFSLSKPSEKMVFPSVAPSTTASVTPATTGTSTGFLFSTGSAISSSAVNTSTTSTSTVSTAFSFGGNLPSSSNTSTLGFSFNKPSPTSTGTPDNSGSSFSVSAILKSKPVTSSSSPSSEELLKVALPSTGKTAAAVGNLDITTGGSAMPVTVKGQELHFPHQESSPSQVAEVNDQDQNSNASSSEASVKPEVALSTNPSKALSIGSEAHVTSAATKTSGSEPTPTPSQSLLATPTSATVTSSSNKNLMGLLASDDEPATSSATSTSSTTIFNFTQTNSGNSGFSFTNPSSNTIGSATTSVASTSASTGFSFGQTPAAAASSNTIGSATTSVASTSASTGFSFFGQTPAAAAPTSTNSGSIFGSTSTAFGSTMFGSKTGGNDEAGTGAGSSFGSSALFGKKPEESKQVSTSGLMFGSGAGATDDCGTGNPVQTGFSFSSGSAFNSTDNASGHTFGQSNAQSSVFGQKCLFGSAQQAPSGGGSGGGASEIFGSGIGGGGGGGMFSGLGGKPNPEAAKVNPFGVTKTATTPAFGGPSLFGGQTQKKFGGTDEAGAFSTPGPFSSNSGGFGFGKTTAASNPAGGFGSPPMFGASQSFGGTGFGSTPTFSSPLGSFGGSTSTGAGFSAFAHNDTPGFGNIANQGSAGFASMGSEQPSAFGTGFGQQNQGSVFGGANTFGAASSPFGGAGGQAFSNSSGPFGNNTPTKSPSFTGWR
ncbi:nuclear pore complex protein Nup214-like isoform X1 [Anneissia japonica]|uniref:nuclear pore complex protein Nup214-like isoform X1 n=1 Tax=Anneissia japonica TaxID=1529436 RepID=UPI00142570EC|nr:nuclear pore complex protein Nup214-like isoform X1 [Anneissia japonica]XP_033114893.1 nuclear pore complex protein Nup214-like isoform X1 [Anneissia japonica]XP_033114894.1 nuclear pore complex protein Nup214-like isoform X1 [Anneissia japonica]